MEFRLESITASKFKRFRPPIADQKATFVRIEPSAVARQIAEGLEHASERAG